MKNNQKGKLIAQAARAYYIRIARRNGQRVAHAEIEYQIIRAFKAGVAFEKQQYAASLPPIDREGARRMLDDLRMGKFHGA